MSPMNPSLADRVMVLRDEVLSVADHGEAEPPGAEIFDAIVRAIVARDETSPGLDMALHDTVSRRLAWGEREDVVLADADAVCQRLLTACKRAFRNPEEEILVVNIATEVVCTAARVVAMASVGRAGRERAACLREELTQRQLRQALGRQQEEQVRLRELLGESE